ncbi:MAG: ribosome-associated translation inhibitor RaiA [Firmicutes bacterium]|nr:ribosome-associated translation inhibitor RaiA [Bacillota bacterium]
MQINVHGKDLTVTDALRTYVEKKIGRLDERYNLQALSPATVTLSVQRGQHIVEVTLPFNHLVLRAEERTDDMYAAIDLVADKLERQIRKYKTRIHRKLRQKTAEVNEAAQAVAGGAVSANHAMGGAETEEEEDQPPELVRVKRFAFKPMTVDEAILQMELLGHNFFVFKNADDGEVNVVYRRRDGSCGLIAPEG